MFQSLTLMLEGEISTLGYPRAALFGFGIALCAYNVLSSVQAALRAKFGVDKVQDEVSGYYIANEVRATASGMAIAVEPIAWERFQTATPAAMAKEMLRWADRVNPAKLKRHPRGVKKPVPGAEANAPPEILMYRPRICWMKRERSHLERTAVGAFTSARSNTSVTSSRPTACSRR